MHHFVLHSGGLSSTACLHRAVYSFGKENVSAIHVDFMLGGMTTSKQTLAFIDITEQLDIYRHELFIDTEEYALTSPIRRLYRTGPVLHVAAMYANDWMQRIPGNGDDKVILYTGTHSGAPIDWQRYDKSVEFLQLTARAIANGTDHRVEVDYPFLDNTLEQVIQIGRPLGIDWNLTWSCHYDGEIHCGECSGCQSRQEAFQANHILDATRYLT